MGAGLVPEDVQLVRGRETVTLEIAGTADRLDLGTGPDPAMAIREIRFEDGTVWTGAMLAAMALSGSDGDDLIFGSGGAEALAGLASAAWRAGAGGRHHPGRAAAALSVSGTCSAPGWEPSGGASPGYAPELRGGA